MSEVNTSNGISNQNKWTLGKMGFALNKIITQQGRKWLYVYKV